MDIMQAILEIENKANGIKESADELKKQQNYAVNAEIRAKEEEFNRKLNDKCEGLKEQSFYLRGKKMEELEKLYAEKLEFIEKRCSDNMDDWVNQIFEAVIRSDESEMPFD